MKHAVTAVLLCGGKGERLRPLTESMPKPLVRIKGRPILAYLLEHIRAFGIDDIVIAAGFKAEKIAEFVRAERLAATLVDSGDVDIIARIRACAPHLRGDFIVFYGDTLADVDLAKLQAFHYAAGARATITLYPLKSQFGLASLDGEDNVTRFEEKPVLDRWINIGHFYYTQEALGWMRDFDSYAAFLEHLGRERRLKGFRHDGVHITVNTLRELEEAEQNIHEFTAERRADAS